MTRKWLDQAKAQGQSINASAQDGTYAAGVNHVTELMPVLMNDISQTAPEEQKVRYFECLNLSYTVDLDRLTGDRATIFALVLSYELQDRFHVDNSFLSPYVLHGNSHTCYSVGQDQKASRYLGEGSNFPCRHATVIPREAQHTYNLKYVVLVSRPHRNFAVIQRQHRRFSNHFMYRDFNNAPRKPSSQCSRFSARWFRPSSRTRQWLFHS